MEWSYVTWDFLRVTLGFRVATMYCFVNFIWPLLHKTAHSLPLCKAKTRAISFMGTPANLAALRAACHGDMDDHENWTKKHWPLMALMGATPFTQDMEIWTYHCQHRSMTSTSRLDLCHLSTPSCFRQLFQQHIMLPLCLHLGRNHLVQGFLHSLLLLKNHGMFVLIQTNEAEGWERFQTLITFYKNPGLRAHFAITKKECTLSCKGWITPTNTTPARKLFPNPHVSAVLPGSGRISDIWMTSPFECMPP